MLNNICKTLREYHMVSPGETVVCCVSGGADSMALLFALYLLAKKLNIQVSAAHFNHGLRGEESDRDAAFVRDFCRGYGISLYEKKQQVTPGKKGLEAACREARYAFFRTLPGKIATAHTADDNAETLLLHLIRGTGLKGLGGITPVNGRLIRPMLMTTREQVLAFLQEYHIPFVEDSTNRTDDFLRNRLRHHVMPLLRQENPRLPENLSAAAQRLRRDEAVLDKISREEATCEVERLRKLEPAIRCRVLGRLLEGWGVKEPAAEHIAALEALVFSPNPSARVSFPNGVTVQRCYGALQKAEDSPPLAPCAVNSPGRTETDEITITCCPAQKAWKEMHRFTVQPQGQLILRCRQPGDEITLPGGTKTLKKLWIDKKIPASLRNRIPVLADDAGVVAVWGIGPNRKRLADAGVEIRWEAKHKETEGDSNGE